MLLNIWRQFIWDPGIVMSLIAVGLSKELWIFWEFPVLMAGNNGDWLARISDIPTKLRREIRLTRGWERYFSPRTTIYHQSIYFRYYSVTLVQLFHDLWRVETRGRLMCFYLLWILQLHLVEIAFSLSYSEKKNSNNSSSSTRCSSIKGLKGSRQWY